MKNQDDHSEVSGINLVNDILANYQYQDEAQVLIMEMGFTQYMNSSNVSSSISSRVSTPILPPTPPSGTPIQFSTSTPSESPPSGPSQVNNICILYIR